MKLTGVIVRPILDDNAADLKLSWVTGLESVDCASSVDFAKEATPAADLVEHLSLIHPNRIQVLGKPEIIYYQRLSEENHERQMGELILLEPPFLVVASGVNPPSNLGLRCTRSPISLLTPPISSVAVINHLRLYLSYISAPRVTIYGMFLDILGTGVLIMGDLDLGKSELGLELISRGRGLVADSAVDFVRSGPDSIEGYCPPLLQNLLEMCGLGLLDIKMILGKAVVHQKMEIELIVQLVRCNDGEFERLPLDSQHLDVFGLLIHMVKIQVAAGRNLVVLVEAAVRNTILRLCDTDTLRDFMGHQQATIQTKAASHPLQDRLP